MVGFSCDTVVMADKLNMSLDDVVKQARASKEGGKGPGGKARKDRGGKKEAPYDKKGGGKKEAPKKKEPKEKKEREPPPPPEPNELVFVGNLPFTSEAAALETYIGTVASCTVAMKKRKNDKPAGFAIATFADVESATKVVTELAETEFEGRRLLLRFARPEKAE